MYSISISTPCTRIQCKGWSWDFYVHVSICVWAFLQLYKLYVMEWRVGDVGAHAPALHIFDISNTERVSYVHKTTQRPRLPNINADGLMIKLRNEAVPKGVHSFKISYLALTVHAKDLEVHPAKGIPTEPNGEYKRHMAEMYAHIVISFCRTIELLDLYDYCSYKIIPDRVISHEISMTSIDLQSP